MWAEAEEDCSKALELKSDNVKGKYRRAIARFELGKMDVALQDVEEVIVEFSDVKSKAARQEAMELKQKILEAMKASSPKGDEGGKIAKPASPKKEVSAEIRAPGLSGAEGWRRLDIVETSDDEDSEEEPDTSKKEQVDSEEYPDIKIDHTQEGVEKAKNHANSLFAAGKFQEAARWFSKCLWLVSSKHVGVSAELHSILLSNRAYAYVKLEEWVKADADCNSALDLNSGNQKAQYRRAMARLELGNVAGALEDVNSHRSLAKSGV
jgi:tetratricopeptide (TPR) repeat protein